MQSQLDPILPILPLFDPFLPFPTRFVLLIIALANTFQFTPELLDNRIPALLVRLRIF